MTKITKHARERIKKRVGSKDAERMFGEALLDGTKFSETKGDLKRYLRRGVIVYHSDCIVYKGFIYWHSRTALITVTPLPQKFNKYIKPKEIL